MYLLGSILIDSRLTRLPTLDPLLLSGFKTLLVGTDLYLRVRGFTMFGACMWVRLQFGTRGRFFQFFFLPGRYRVALPSSGLGFVSVRLASPVRSQCVMPLRPGTLITHPTPQVRGSSGWFPFKRHCVDLQTDSVNGFRYVATHTLRRYTDLLLERTAYRI